MIEMAYAKTITFWIARLDSPKGGPTAMRIPIALCEVLSMLGVDVDPEHGLTDEPCLVCYNSLFKEMEVIKPMEWSDLIPASMAMIYAEEKFANYGDTV